MNNAYALILISLAVPAILEEVHVSYSLLPDMQQLLSVNFTGNADMTFYDLMLWQSEKSPEKWKVTSTTHPIFGEFITSIGGLANDANKRMAWQYYILPEFPIAAIPDDKYRGTEAVDRTILEDNKHYLFIYMGY